MNFPSPVPSDHGLVLRAVRFAIERHEKGKQPRRKYTNDPYVIHLVNVASMVAQHTMDPHVIAAAVLHDVIEDTPTSYREVGIEFGKRVADYVVELTDHYTKETYPKMNRPARKAAEAVRIGRISEDAMVIKAYDLIDNTSTIVPFDPGFARVYIPEKRRVFEQMAARLKAHNPHVFAVLEDSLLTAERQLAQQET